MAARPALLLPGPVLEALVDPMQRLGFDREPPWLTVAGEGGKTGGIAASWLRVRLAPGDDPRRTGDWEAVDRHGNADGVSVLRDGYINIGVAGTHTRIEWRKTMLEPDELALSVEAFVESLDRFAPPR